MHKHRKEIQRKKEKHTQNKINAKKVEKIFFKTKISKKKRGKTFLKNPLEKFPNFVTFFKQVLLVQTCLHIACDIA
jgi:hypothetical protein